MALLTRAAATASNAQLAALLDHSDEAMLLFDARLRLAHANRVARQLLGAQLGQSPEQALARLDAVSGAALLAALTEATALERQVVVGGALWHGSLSGQAPGGRLLRFKPMPGLQAMADPGSSGALVRLLWDGGQPLLLLGPDFRVQAANRSLCQLLGLPLDQVLGRDGDAFWADDPGNLEGQAEREAERATLRAALQAQQQPAMAMERRLRDGLGTERWWRSSPRWISADDGAPLLLLLLHEVTLQRDAAASAEPADAAWFELNPVGMAVYQRGGQVLRSNPAFAALVGAAPKHLRDAPGDLCELLGWDGAAIQPELWPDAPKPPPPAEVNATLTLPDGRRVQLRARLRHLGDGEHALVMAVVEDRSLEDERDLAQLEIGALMDTAGVGVATYEASRGWLFSRPVRAETSPAAGGVQHGLHPSLQSIRRDQVEPSSQADYERLQAALRNGQRAQERYAVRVPQLGLRWLLTRVEPGELAGGRAALSVVTLDVTEQELAHRRNEQLLRELSTILDGTSAGIAYLRDGRLLRCNQAFQALLGLAPGCVGSPLAQAFADQPEVQALLAGALAGANDLALELPPQTRANAMSPWLALSLTRSLADDQVEVVAVLTDVSHLKAQQLELEAVVRERELMFSLSEVGIAHVRSGRIERANAALARLSGYSVAELEQLPLSNLFESPEQFAMLTDQQHIALTQTGRFSGERRLRRRDGHLGWVQVSKRLVDAQQPSAGLICSYVDVDERRQVREALQLQAERTRAILDSVLVGIVTVGDAGIEWMNRSARRMFGGELADFVGQPMAIVATDEPHHPLRATHYREALSDGQAETFECRLRGRDGREFWVVGNAVVTGRESGSAVAAGGSQITFALLDIERRRQAEVSIAQAQASLQRIIDTAPLAIALFDAASARVLRLNQMAATFVGKPAAQVLSHPPEDWFSADDARSLRQDFALAQRGTEALRREMLRALPAGDDGVAAPVRIWDVRIVWLDTGNQTQVLLVGSDVTEQRLAEQARFEAAVSQRELLIKEVHHRIKNNLQGVAGLLQQTAARRPDVAQLIGEAVGQVHAIAQVHGLHVGLSGPLLIEPLLQAITATVQRTFGRGIRLFVNGAPAYRYALPEAESIPIALTVNELLTNAIKHSADGEIECGLHCDDAAVTVTVRSLGRLRDGFSLAQVPPGVSGLGLVRALLPRRTATMSLVQDGNSVLASIVLVPPGVTLLEPADMAL